MSDELEAPEPKKQGLDAWQIVIVVTALVAAVALGGGAYLSKESAERSRENRQTTCSIGSFLTAIPIVRTGTREQFLTRLVVTRKFLRDLRDLDCEDIQQFGREVDVDQINARLVQLARRIAGQRQRIQEARGDGPADGDDRPPAAADSPGAGAASGGDGGGGGGNGPAGGGGDPDEPPTGPPTDPPGAPPTDPPPPSKPPPPDRPSLGDGVGGVVDEATGTVCQVTPRVCDGIGLP